MVGAEAGGGFDHWSRRNQRLELVGSRIVGQPGRRRRAVWIAGSREGRPVADHRRRELLLGRVEQEEESSVEQVLDLGAVVRAQREGQAGNQSLSRRRVLVVELVGIGG